MVLPPVLRPQRPKQANFRARSARTAAGKRRGRKTSACCPPEHIIWRRARKADHHQLASMDARALALTPLANITVPSSSSLPLPSPTTPLMPSGQKMNSHIAAGASVGLVVLLCFLTCFICRVWRRNRYYSKVQRTLDDEERAFQECALAAARPQTLSPSTSPTSTTPRPYPLCHPKA